MVGERGHSAWDRFWHYDRLSSFETGPGAANYGANVADGWTAFFAALGEAPAILDLCTGNGAIALLAAEARPDAAVSGIDFADIDPARFCSGGGAAMDRVAFRGRVMAEDLPLDDGSMDAVASQYGIEYSDMNRSLPEAMRVLRGGGRLRLAMHAAEGAVVRDTLRSLEDADFLLGKDGLIEASRTSYASLARYERGEPSLAAVAQADFARFRDALAAAEAHESVAMDRAMLRSVRTDVITKFNERRTADPAAALAALERLAGEIRDHRDRQRALVAAAKTHAEVEGFAATLRAAGFTGIAIGTQDNRGETIAHLIEATAP